MVVRDLLTRGLLAGLLAGIIALGVAELIGEPQVSRAIAVETTLHQQEGKSPEPVVVSRDLQSTAGLATGVLIIGTSLGGIFALAFAFAYGRIGRFTPRLTALLVALAGFVGLYLIPFLKYPANPPSVGQPTTIGHRTGLYFGMILISVVSVAAAIMLARRLTDRFGAWNAVLVSLGGLVAVIAAVYWLMPAVNEVPPAFPAVTLWRFRIASLATQLTLWAGIGIVFGILTDRSRSARAAALG